ncbi:MAG: hypothetical protein WD226_08100 [Planctomycetota bacterium]
MHAPHGIQSALRHAIAAGVVVFGTVGLTVLGYFGMLVWAVLTDTAIGGVLALPFLLLLALVGASVGVAVVLLPATLGAHLVRQRFRLPLIAEIPLSTALAFLIVMTIGYVAGRLWATPVEGFRLGFLASLGLLVPLGLYWWSLQAAHAVQEGLLRVAGWIRSRWRGRRSAG